MAAGEIIKKHAPSITTENVTEDLSNFLKGGAGIAVGIGASYAKKENKNIKEYQKNKNRGINPKKISPKQKEFRVIEKESIENAKKFAGK